MQVTINPRLVLRLEGSVVLTFFLLTLLVALRGHYVDIVKNHISRYPVEWFPSASSVLGDYYPARSLIQFGMAAAATPRFLNVNLRACCSLPPQLDMSSITGNVANLVLIASDLVRTVAVGGFIYVTSSDHNSVHSLFMLVYLVSTFVYMNIPRERTKEQNIVRMAYAANIGCMVVHAYRHLVLGIPGSYSTFAVFEWLLIPLDVFYDQLAMYDGSFAFSEMVDYVNNVWEALLFWTNLAQLPALLWYFPLWNMGLSGFEFGLLAYFTPLLSPLLWTDANNSSPCTTFTRRFDIRIFAGLGFVASRIINVKARFLLICIATGTSNFVFFSKMRWRPASTAYHLFVGLLVYLATKFVNDGISPLWTIEKNDELHTAHLGMHVILFLLTIQRQKITIIPSKPSKPTATKCCLSQGAALFIVHKLFTDLETFPMILSNGALSGVKAQMLNFIMITLCGGVLGRHVAMQMGNSMSSFRNAALVMGTYVLFLLADIWTVAYAFVPGGNLLRERSGLVLASAFLLAIAFDDFETGWRMERKKFTVPLIVTLYLTTTISAMMKLNVQYNRHRLVTIRDPNVLTVGIWTVHFGLDNDGYLSHRNMTNLIRKLDLDVVGLLESDTMRTIGGNRNMLTYMSHRLHMHYVYGPNPMENTWGCSLLSKYPIVNYTTYLLPSPVGERACAIHATIRVPSGKSIDIITSHNGQEEDELDRTLQTETIAGMANATENSVVFIGYLVTKPGEGNSIYELMTKQGRLTDIYSADKWRWCEYIFYRNLFPLAYARISHGRVTDTELQSAKFWIGGNETELHMNEGPNGNMYPSDLIDTEWNGHRYHIFNAPIYGPGPENNESKHVR